jgi:hypothetical protein
MEMGRSWDKVVWRIGMNRGHSSDSTNTNLSGWHGCLGDSTNTSSDKRPMDEDRVWRLSGVAAVGSGLETRACGEVDRGFQ